MCPPKFGIDLICTAIFASERKLTKKGGESVLLCKLARELEKMLINI